MQGLFHWAGRNLGSWWPPVCVGPLPWPSVLSGGDLGTAWRTLRPRNWALNCSPCPFGNNTSLLWEQEEKCHSTVVQSYWKDKSGITRDIKNISTPNKKLKQYSFHIHCMCVSESGSFMQRSHWHIQSLKFKNNSQRGCSVESLPLYLESNLIFLLLGCELYYSTLHTLLS